MTETQSIAWRRLSIEATVIVASILLAFAIDAWWEERVNVGPLQVAANSPAGY